MAHRRHDRVILDALDAMRPEAFAGEVWRVTAPGRDPLRGSTADGRWSPAGEFEVLHTSLERDGALTEIGYRLSLEPVWPSRAQHAVHRIAARTARALRFPDVASLQPFGVDGALYATFAYGPTQALAAAARFLGCDSLSVPSARSPALHLVVFPDVLPDDGALTVLETEDVDWGHWRRTRR
jgi:hypothetical protein